MSNALDYTPQKIQLRTFANLTELFVLNKFDGNFEPEFIENVNLDPTFIMDCLFHKKMYTFDIKVGDDPKQLWSIQSNVDIMIQIFKWASLTVSTEGRKPKMEFENFISKYCNNTIKEPYFNLSKQEKIKFVGQLYFFEFVIRFV